MHLWDIHKMAMRMAVTMHHQLLQRHIHICGGYEVKTEGDAFMVAFMSVSAALLWCSSGHGSSNRAYWTSRGQRRSSTFSHDVHFPFSVFVLPDK
jgi:hypothetical protein